MDSAEVYSPLTSESPSADIRESSELSNSTLKDQNEPSVELNANGVPIVEENYSTEVMLEALSKFTYIDENEYLGLADGLAMQDEAMTCQCQYGNDGVEEACGEQCINRMLFVECSPRHCPVGEACRNRRMQKKEYAAIEIFQTSMKGYGIRTKEELKEHQFVIEYVGEVVSATSFRKRTKQYEENGEKHFYFMSLKTDQVIDATKKGGIARFINHSCDPNCVLQKWVVGKHLRMGIFTKKPIAEGEELTFDYKFERYGAPCQICLCGSPNCKGTIGVSKEVTSTTLITSFEESDNDDDSSDDSAGGSSSKNLSKGLVALESNDDVIEFCKSFVRSSSKPNRVNKFVDRLIATESVQSLRKFVQMNGLVLIKIFLKPHLDNSSICRKILTILNKLPIATRNTVDDSRIMDTIETMKSNKDPIISTLSQKLEAEWSKLERMYRIPKAPKSKDEISQAKRSRESSISSASANAEEETSEIYGRDSKKRRKTFFNSREWIRPGSRRQSIPSPTDQPSEQQQQKDKNPDREDTIQQQQQPQQQLIISNEVSKDILDKIAEEAKKAVEEESKRLYKDKKKKKEKEKAKIKKEQEKKKLKKEKRQETTEKEVEDTVEDREEKIDGDTKRSLRDEISVVVIKYFSRFKQELSAEDFKKHARKVTHLLIEKAAKNKEEQMNDEMKKKIKKFVDTYWEKMQEKKPN